MKPSRSQNTALIKPKAKELAARGLFVSLFEKIALSSFAFQYEFAVACAQFA